MASLRDRLASVKRSSRGQRLSSHRRRRWLPRLELLEDRTLLNAAPLVLADPTVWGATGLKASTTPTISADGQLVAFQSNADDLVPNDTNGKADAFVFNRTTGVVTLISVGHNGAAAGIAGNPSPTPAISPDGRFVAFVSDSSNLVLPGITGTQLYVRDLQTGTTSLVSINAAGTGGTNRGGSLLTRPVWSGDSRYLAFVCSGMDLVSGITYSDNGNNLFVRDVLAGTTRIVSVSPNGLNDANAEVGSLGGEFALSHDGRYVAFTSTATNLTVFPTQAIEQVYVRDMTLQLTTMVSMASSNLAGAAGHNRLNTTGQAISADGRYVVFHSNAQDIVTTPVTGTVSYLRDLRTRSTVVASAALNGQGVNSVGSQIISPDGKWTAFATAASGVTSLPTNNKTNVYVRNNQTGAVALVSVNRQGTAGGNQNSGLSTFFDFPGGLSFSADSRYLTFRSLATDLVDGVTSSHRNLYARDLLTNTTRLLTPNAAGNDAATGDSDPAVLSADGRVIAFASHSANLIAGDGNSASDVFVRDIAAAHPVLASRRSPLFGAETLPLQGATVGGTSADGRYVVFTSLVNNNRSDIAPDVVFNTAGGNQGTYVLDRQTGKVKVVDLLANNQQAGSLNPTAQQPIITPDGRYVLFLSRSTALDTSATYTPGAVNLFIRDMQSQQTRLVSVTPDGSRDIPVPQNTLFAVSDNGRYVAFTTHAANPFAGVTNNGNGRHYILMRDLGAAGVSPTTTLVSRTPPDGNGVSHITGDSTNLALSSDGRYVGFSSKDANLAPNDVNNDFDVFRWDRTTGLVTLVSSNSTSNGTGNARSDSTRTSMSADGRYIAFQSDATNLIAGDTNGRKDIFLRDMESSDPPILVSVNLAGTAGGNNHSSNPSITPDGQRVAFVSFSTNLTADSVAVAGNVFLRTFGSTPATVLVSKNAADTASGNGLSTGTGTAQVPLVSPDGRYVVFTSQASNLVAGYVDGNGSGDDLFIRDVQQGLTRVVNINHAGTATGNTTQTLRTVNLTGNGSTLVFNTSATNIAIGDRNGQDDVLFAATAGFSTISGQVFNDLDADGIKDPGENGMPYWTVFLDADNDGIRDLNEARVFTDAGGNYAFTGLVPGNYTVAIVPQTGYQRTLPAAPGTYAVTLNTDGDGVTGRDFGQVLPLPDLAVSNVTFTPAASGPGQPVQITWTVANLGVGSATGGWQDAIYLSTSPTLDASAILIGTVAREGALPAGQQYVGQTIIDLPLVNEGTYHVIVQSDRRSQVHEGDRGANKANNTAAAAATLPISVPVLTIGTPVNGQFTAPGQARYYKFTAQPGQTIFLNLDSAATTGGNWLYVRQGALPSVGEYDHFSGSLFEGARANPDQTLILPHLQGGTYYVMVRTLFGEASTSSFTLNATVATFEIHSLENTAGGNTGRVTIGISGAHFRPTMTATLTKGTHTITAESVFFQDSTSAYVTFDLTDEPTGGYLLRLSDGAQSSTTAVPFQVENGRQGKIALEIATPRVVRPAPAANAGAASVGIASFADLNPRQESSVVIEYENTGNVDGVAPLLELTSNLAQLRLQRNEAFTGSGALQILAISQTGPAGILRPGQKGQIKVRFATTAPLGSTLSFQVSPLENLNETIDWNAQKNDLRPPTISSEAWDAIYANLATLAGTTSGSYQQLLAQNATYLSELGEYTYDVSRLFSFLIQQANASIGGGAAPSAIDAGTPAPGFPLVFTRSFASTISGRYETGMLGRGWASNWDISASIDANGLFTIRSGGGFRFFQRQPDGSFAGGHGDHALLKQTSTGWLIREEDGAAEAFRADGKLDYLVDIYGNRITAAYNPQGQLTSLTHSNGDSLQLTYNANGRLATVTDAFGRVTTYGYDASGQHLTSVTDAAGTTQYAYVSSQGAAREHALASLTHPDGTQAFFEYDSLGRFIGGRLNGDALPITVSYGTGARVTVIDASNAQATVYFNDAGQVVRAFDPLNRFSEARYDDHGNLVLFVTSLGTTYRYGYDDHGNVISAIDPLGQQISMEYEGPFHRLSKLTDARGQRTEFAYTPQGELRTITYNNGTRESFAYDPLGNLVETTNRRGRAIDYTYDTRGRVTRKTFADASRVDYAYDARGNLQTVTDAQGTTTFQYDAADRLTKTTYPNGRFLQFTYDAGGRRIQSVDQGGFTIKYQYDAVGRLSRLTDGSDNLIVRYVYDVAGRLVEKGLGNGAYTTYAYDLAGQLLHLVNHAPRPQPDQDGPVNSRFDYTYDALGRRTSMTVLEGVWTYTYDATSQITHAVFASNDTNVLPNQDLAYVYDAAGNRVRTILNGVTTSYVANNANEYTSVGNVTYTYDADGNMLTMTDGGGTTTYTWDDENQLISVSGPGGNFTYEYDAGGARSAEVVNGVRTEFLLDPFTGQRTAEYTAGGSLIASYVWAGGLVSRVAGGGAAAYYDFDAIGSTAGMTDATGAYQNRYSYLPFGETTTHLAGVPNPFTFVGQFGVVQDAPSRFQMHFRAYDATTGRFLSNDPIGLAGGDTNLRRYVSNNPVMLIDPLGLKCSDAEKARMKQLEDEINKWERKISEAKRFADILKHGIGTPLIREGVDARHAFLADIRVVSANNPTIPAGYKVIPAQWESSTNNRNHYRDRFNEELPLHWRGKADAAAAELDQLRSKCSDPLGGGRKPRGSRQQPVPQGAFCKVKKHGGKSHSRGDSPSTMSGSAGPSPECPGAGGGSGVGGSVDPNDITGPAGFGPQGYLRPDQVMPYRIRFENDPVRATLAAQDVIITHTLDADLDWTTFELGDMAFGSTTLDTPEGLQAYVTSVLTTSVDGTPLRVDIEASVNLVTGLVTWLFRSLDPLTGEPPENPVAGFLPVNDASHRGEGEVHFTIRSKPSLATGTKIDQQASIVFDTNAPLLTNIFTNTIDAVAPTGLLNVLPPVTTSLNIPLSWTGHDDVGGAGVATYDVFVSDNGGPFTLFLDDTTQTSATFTGLDLHTYRFFVLATDNVGNIQPESSAVIWTTQIARPPAAFGDVYAADAGRTLTVAATSGVLKNDKNTSPARTLRAVLVDNVSKGTLTLRADGSFTYVPGATFDGLDFFTYKIRDNTGKESNTAVVYLATQIVNFRSTAVTVSEGTASTLLTVDLRLAPAAEQTVEYIVTPVSATPGGVDFTLASGILTFAAGQKSQTLSVSFNNDLLDELTEKFQVTLRNPSGNTVVGPRPTQTVNITDNDPTPTLGFRTSTSSAAENVNGSIEVFLSAASGRTVTVKYAVNTSQSTAKGNGIDFTLPAGMLTFAPGETSKLITFPVVNDALDEPNEKLVVTLSSISGALAGTRLTHTYTILDDDAPPTVAFTQGTSSFSENAGTVLVPVTLSGASGRSITVRYTVTGLTARPNEDFVLASGTLTFSTGQTTRNLAVRIINDSISEGAETLQIVLSAPTNATLGGTTTHVLTIEESDRGAARGAAAAAMLTDPVVFSLFDDDAHDAAFAGWQRRPGARKDYAHALIL